MSTFCDLADPSEQSQWSVYKLTGCKHSLIHARAHTHFALRALYFIQTSTFCFTSIRKTIIPIAVEFLLIPSESITVFVDIQLFGLYMASWSELHLSLLRMEFTYLAVVSPPSASSWRKHHMAAIKQSGLHFNNRSFHPSFVQKLISLSACERQSSFCQNNIGVWQ